MYIFFVYLLKLWIDIILKNLLQKYFPDFSSNLDFKIIKIDIFYQQIVCQYYNVYLLKLWIDIILKNGRKKLCLEKIAIIFLNFVGPPLNTLPTPKKSGKFDQKVREIMNWSGKISVSNTMNPDFYYTY